MFQTGLQILPENSVMPLLRRKKTMHFFSFFKYTLHLKRTDIVSVITVSHPHPVKSVLRLAGGRVVMYDYR